MALKESNPSLKTRQALLAGLADIVDSREKLKDIPQEFRPLKVYSLMLRDLAGGGGVERAKLVAWRFLAGNASGKAIGGEIELGENEDDQASDGAPVNLSLLHGDPAAQVFRGLRAVEKLTEHDDGKYELRLLRIPGFIEVLWLQSETDAHDMVVPFRPLFSQLQPMQPIPLAEFLNTVRPMASKRLVFEDSSHGQMA